MRTFDEAKAEKTRLTAIVERAQAVLNTFPKTGAMGLTADAVKFSPEYQTASRDFVRAFNALRAFNQVFVRAFANELREERRARRGYA